jgi:hypothetical protein
MASLKYIGGNKKPELARIDHQEMYPNISRQFDVLTEFINGPCEENQKLLVDNMNIGELEILLKMIKRPIRNLESPFVELQCKAVC